MKKIHPYKIGRCLSCGDLFNRNKLHDGICARCQKELKESTERIAREISEDDLMDLFNETAILR